MKETGITLGARTIEIAFWCNSISERVVKARLGARFAFVTVTRPREGARWAVSFALHPLTQDQPGAYYVGEACAALQIPKGTRIAWNDSWDRGGKR